MGFIAGTKNQYQPLTREINISAIPLREALSRLNSENLVVLEPNKGYRVSDILDTEKMAKMLEARILLETHAVRNIIRLNNVSVTEEMAALTDEMFSTNTGASNKKILDFTHLDQQFHHAIMNAGRNPFLFEAYKGMHCHLHIGRFYHVKGESTKKTHHRNIWKSLRPSGQGMYTEPRLRSPAIYRIP